MSAPAAPDVVCGERAATCICGREPCHNGEHECGRVTCRGQWIGTYGQDDWAAVRFPMVFVLDEELTP